MVSARRKLIIERLKLNNSKNGSREGSKERGSSNGYIMSSILSPATIKSANGQAGFSHIEPPLTQPSPKRGTQPVLHPLIDSQSPSKKNLRNKTSTNIKQ